MRQLKRSPVLKLTRLIRDVVDRSSHYDSTRLGWWSPGDLLVATNTEDPPDQVGEVLDAVLRA